MKINFDFKTAAVGLGLTYADTIQFFLDGRRISMLLEKRVSNLNGYKKATSESDPYDAIDPHGKKIEVRCLTKKVIFRPSDQIGAGRKFNENDFYFEKIKKVDYFMVCDVNEEDLKSGFVNTFDISSELVWSMYKQNLLGKNAEKSRKSFLTLMEEHKLYERTKNSISVVG
jgi:hypothetical protein